MMRKPPRPEPTIWTIHKIAAKVTWHGTVEANDETDAIEKAACGGIQDQRKKAGSQTRLVASMSEHGGVISFSETRGHLATVVIEALVEHTKQWDQSGNAPKHRHKFRAVFIEYAEERLREERERERRLAQAIIDADLPND